MGGFITIPTSLDEKSKILFGANVFRNSMDMPAVVEAAYPQAINQFYEVQKEEPYLSVSPLVGIRVLEELAAASSFFFSGMAGVMFSRNPEIELGLPLQDEYVIVHQERDRATSFTWAVECGIIFHDEIEIGVRYQYSNPEYTVRGSLTNEDNSIITESLTLTQPTSTIQFVVGLFP